MLVFVLKCKSLNEIVIVQIKI